jgi:hypothetical protein
LGGPIDLRLDRDVFAYNPTVITVMLGMNDGEYRPYDDGIFHIFANGYRHILDRIKAAAPEARVTLLQPSAYDDFTRPPEFAQGYNAVLLRYGRFVPELARASELTVADLNAPVVALLKGARAASPKPAEQLIPDRVHTSPGVHLVMAEALLLAWGAPSVVSILEPSPILLALYHDEALPSNVAPRLGLAVRDVGGSRKVKQRLRYNVTEREAGLRAFNVVLRYLMEEGRRREAIATAAW